MKLQRLVFGTVIGFGALAWVATGWAQDKMAMDHAMYSPESIAWTDAPASLPKGAHLSVLEGDPAKPGAFTMRLKLPANFRIPPHWHPADEHVTIIQGTLYLGFGESFDEAKLRMIPTGGFSMMATGVRHFARSGNTETIVQVHGIGPWGINYVNDADDPRKKQ